MDFLTLDQQWTDYLKSLRIMSEPELYKPCFVTLNSILLELMCGPRQNSRFLFIPSVWNWFVS